MLNIIETTQIYAANNITPYPLTLTHGQGCMVYDETGKTYLDMISGISVANFGHQHPRLLHALMTQANKIAIIPRLFYQEPLAQLLKAACDLCEMDKALPMNSGAEAVETAIKIARKWGYIVKNIANNQAEIITCDNSFHGRTVTTVSLSTIAKYKENFGPLTPGFVSIPFNDACALEKVITPNTCAFIVEPIQGEAGVIVPTSGYLKACEEICKKNQVLFLLDEIQTGMGRTGKAMAYQHDNIKPDGLLMGKALGGGLLPISLFLAKNHLMEVIHPGEHGSTFGGNALASFVAYEAIKTLLQENLAENSAVLGDYFLKELKKIKSPAIKEVRGQGLFIAIELESQLIESKKICQQLLDNGLLVLDTRQKMIRLLPPLIITKTEIEQAVMIIRQVLAMRFF